MNMIKPYLNDIIFPASIEFYPRVQHSSKHYCSPRDGSIYVTHKG